MGVQLRATLSSWNNYAPRGQLSAINYETAQATLETTKAASTKRTHEADYKDADLDVYPVQLIKKRKVWSIVLIDSFAWMYISNILLLIYSGQDRSLLSISCQ